MAKKITLLLMDFIVLYISLLITLLIRYGSRFDDNIWQMHFWPFFLIFMVWIVVFYIFNLYDLSFKKNLELFSEIIKSIFIGGLIAAIFFYLASSNITNIKPQITLLIDIFVSVALIYFTRRLFQNIIKIPGLVFNTLIIGVNNHSIELARSLASNKFFGYKLIGIYDNTSSSPKYLDEKITVFNKESLNQLLKGEHINTVINTIDLKDDSTTLNTLLNSLNLKIKFFNYPTFYERLYNKLPVAELEQTWFLENLSENKKPIFEFFKRLIDVVVSFFILLCSLPFIPLIILIIKIDSSGPIFFRQTRVGKNNKIFYVLKFRSMKTDAEISGPQWAQKNDPRVTGFGKIMRKARLDEIPQLLNVLKNDMSLVGPRPERPEFVESLQNQIPFYNERHLVKPGLTGWAQILGPAYGGSKDETLEKIKYDLFYIKNRSIFLDLGIILKTINIVLKWQGR